ncbi:MAG: IclR family transcriptional regulator [Spirochaetales bacterium]|nr:IclR family transcriptional regulator [Spirochaetales bacterium]
MPSIKKTHEILELLRKKYKTGLTSKEISAALNIPLSTCYRILASLKKYDYVQQKPNDMHYYLGFVHLRFAQALMEGLDENAIIDPYLEELHQKTGLTTLFSRLSGQHCVAMEVRGAVETRISVGVGEVMPLHCSAAGKVILAFMNEKQIEKLIPQLDMVRKTPATICDINVLKKNLATVRKTGTSYNQGEINQGINSLATPLFNRNNQVFGALVLVGTSQDLPIETLRSYSGLFHKTGRQITSDLGGQYPDWIIDTD